MPDLLPRGPRIAFRNMCSSIFLGAISDMFEAEGFAPDSDHVPTVSGSRRGLVEQYQSSIDWEDPAEVSRVLRVYSRALRGHGRSDQPGVRWCPEAERLVDELVAAGFRVDDRGSISSPAGRLDRGITLDDLQLLDDPEFLAKRIDRMEASIETDPDRAIGDAKELVETTCKLILAKVEGSPDKNIDLPALYKRTARALKLDVESVPESRRGSGASHQVLRSLASAVQGMSELRNEIGTGHGPARRSPAQPRHARLAVGSAKTLVAFLLETWSIRRSA